MTEAVRLARNLDTVEANVRLFGKIMDETDIPGTENANDKKLLEKLDVACREMQERLTILLSELDPENYENVFMNGLRNLDTLRNKRISLFSIFISLQGCCAWNTLVANFRDCNFGRSMSSIGISKVTGQLPMHHC